MNKKLILASTYRAAQEVAYTLSLKRDEWFFVATAETLLGRGEGTILIIEEHWKHGRTPVRYTEILERIRILEVIYKIEITHIDLDKHLRAL